jgi:CRP/FNR family cyclic AMP-dependent transcriptional regulator
MPRADAEIADWFAHPAFSDNLRLLAGRGDIRRYAKGTMLIQEGDIGDTVYVILAGRMRTFSIDHASGREVTYGTFGPGETLGELGLDGGPRSASVIALETSVCSVVARPTLEAFIAEKPAFAFELLAKVIHRARTTTDATRTMALNDVYGRLRRLLDSLAGAPGEEGRLVGERLTHQDIANRIGCTREMVSRVMKDLEKGGYVKADAGRLCLLKPLPARW